MGSAKNLMIEHEDRLNAAAPYLVSIDRLQQCEDHGTIYGGGYWKLEDDYYVKIMGDRKRGVRGPIPWAADMEAQEFKDLLKQAYDDHPGDSCAICEKHKSE